MICFEIKPKWGIVPRPECVRPEHLCKASVCRFCMHQATKLAKGQETSRSQYCPLQLYSCRPESMYTAIEALLATPQNNLRAFVGCADLLRGGGQAALDEWLMSRFLRGLPCGASAASARDCIIRVVVAALLRSRVLQKLLVAQQLDTIDVEGVYARYAQHHPECEPPTWRPHPLDVISKFADDGGEAAAQILFTRFMTATAAKDCSVMLTLQRIAPLDQSDVHGPSSSASGVIECRGALFAFRVGVVDLDGRPVDRIPFYFKHDRYVCCRRPCRPCAPRRPHKVSTGAHCSYRLPRREIVETYTASIASAPPQIPCRERRDSPALTHADGDDMRRMAMVTTGGWEPKSSLW